MARAETIDRVELDKAASAVQGIIDSKKNVIEKPSDPRIEIETGINVHVKGVARYPSGFRTWDR